MVEHTKGPWRVRTARLIDAPVTHIRFDGEVMQYHREVAWTQQVGDDRTRMANANLIAAAPCLLEALEAVELARISDEPDHWQRATDLTNAALTKARGEAK